MKKIWVGQIKPTTVAKINKHKDMSGGVAISKKEEISIYANV